MTVKRERQGSNSLVGQHLSSLLCQLTPCLSLNGHQLCSWQWIAIYWDRSRNVSRPQGIPAPLAIIVRVPPFNEGRKKRESNRTLSHKAIQRAPGQRPQGPFCLPGHCLPYYSHYNFLESESTAQKHLCRPRHSPTSEHSAQAGVLTQLSTWDSQKLTDTADSIKCLQVEWGHGSMIKHVLSMHTAMASVLSIPKRKKDYTFLGCDMRYYK